MRCLSSIRQAIFPPPFTDEEGCAAFLAHMRLSADNYPNEMERVTDKLFTTILMARQKTFLWNWRAKAVMKKVRAALGDETEKMYEMAAAYLTTKIEQSKKENADKKS